MSKFEADILKRRHAEFLREAESALSKGFYDVSCFLAEQALQLFLKYVLLRFVGDYPKTHSVRRLLGEVCGLLNSEELEEFNKANRVRLSALEDAYLMARYFLKEYTKEDAEDMIKLVEEVIEIVDRVMHDDLVLH